MKLNQNLLFFSYDFPPLEGGISRLCDEIVKQFILNKWDIKALSVKRKVQDGFTNSIYPIETVVAQRGLRELHSFQKLFSFPKDTLIITGVWYPEALLVTLAGYKNFVVLAHGNDVMRGESTFKNKMLSTLRKWVLHRAKLVICNSHYTEKVIKEQFPEVNTKVCLLGVDEKRFSPVVNNSKIRKFLGLPVDKKIVLTVSRINKYKAHDVVLNALSKLTTDERIKICYCIAGRGDYVESLKALAVDLGVNDCIHWFGFVDEGQLADLYRASDLFVLCTREEKEQKAVEGFGLVFLEAQACGIPVIGSNQGGIPDAITHCDGGWIIERDDVTSLTQYFVKLVEDNTMFKEEGKKARKRVEKETTWGHFSNCVFEAIETTEEIK